MRIGILTIRLSIREAHSLKEKRRIIKSLKDRLHNTFNASVAEVDAQDAHQTAVLGVSVVGTDGRFVNSVLSKIVDFVRKRGGAELVDYDMEII